MYRYIRNDEIERGIPVTFDDVYKYATSLYGGTTVGEASRFFEENKTHLLNGRYLCWQCDLKNRLDAIKEYFIKED